MRVLLTGATGFIGRAVVPVLRRDGRSVVAWVGSAERARHLVGAEAERVPMTAGIGRIANLVFVRSTLREIFTYRRDVIGLRFGRS